MDVFKDKVVIMTGGASGIGKTVVEELGRRGATVIVSDINESGAHEVAESINKAGGRAQATQLDVTQEEAVRGLIESTASEQGQLDYMFNNAGIALGGEVRDLEMDQWRKIVDINLWGVVYGTTAAYKVMREQGSGHIVNVASVAGLVPVPIETAYAMTKHAVVGLSTSLRIEAETFGVKVTVICPGFIDTNIFEATAANEVNWVDAKSAIKVKLMEPDDAALAILKGVERNEARVVFPALYRTMWRMFRLSPGLTVKTSKQMLEDFRALRKYS